MAVKQLGKEDIPEMLITYRDIKRKSVQYHIPKTLLSSNFG